MPSRVPKPTSSGLTHPLQAPFRRRLNWWGQRPLVWILQTKEELIPGTWLVRVEFLDAKPPVCYAVHTLPEPTELIAAIEQTFTVNRI